MVQFLYVGVQIAFEFVFCFLLPQPCRDTGSDSQTETSEPGPCPSSRSDLPEDPIDCDWSEHICPDGNKYYFNSATFESRVMFQFLGFTLSLIL